MPVPNLIRGVVRSSEPDDDDGLVELAPAVRIREIFRRFWPYTGPFRPWLGLSFLFLVVTPALDAAATWMLKVLVDGCGSSTGMTFRSFGDVSGGHAARSQVC